MKTPFKAVLSVGFLLAVALTAAFLLRPSKKNLLPPKEVWQAVQRFKFEDRPQFSERDLQLAQLGREIFHDTRFSANGKVACATCHQPQKSFTDGLAVAKGVDVVSRNTPTLINSFSGRWFFWDGRADSLEAQVSGPLEAPKEHGISRAHVARLIVTEYRTQYEHLFGKIPEDLIAKIPEEAFPKGVPAQLSEKIAAYALATITDDFFYKLFILEPSRPEISSTERLNSYLRAEDPSVTRPQQVFAGLDAGTRQFLDEVLMNVSMAVATFEKGLVAMDSPFDRFVKSWKDPAAPETALSKDFDDQAYHGLNLFLSKGRCFFCHSGPNFSDGEFHNIGLPANGDLGLGRSVGVLQVKSNPLNCENPWWSQVPEHRERESCKELPFLDPENLEILGSFKTPTLRNLPATAPYTHAGQLKTLEEVVDHYDKLKAQVAVGHREETLKPLGLSADEKQALLAFLRSLNSEVKDLTAVPEKN